MLRKFPLVLANLLAFAFSVAGIGVLINAFVKAHDEHSHLQRLLPTGAKVFINDSNILNTGKVSTAVQAALIFLSVASILSISTARYSFSKIFFALALALGFFSAWLLATTIAFTVIYATKSAGITATLLGIPLPQSIIHSQAQALGLSPVYKDQWYLRVATIIPWFTWLFSTIACILMMYNWMVSRRVVHRSVSEKMEHSTN